MATVVKMPKLGFDMAEGLLVRWVKAEGDLVEKGEVLAEIETDKATVEVEAEIGGIVHKHLVGENTSVPVGSPIAVIGEAGEKVDPAALVGKAASEPVQVAEPAAAGSKSATAAGPGTDGDGRLLDGVRASPVARRLAADGGIDLRSLAGSGPQGRIVKRDVEAALTAGPELIRRAGPARPSGSTELTALSPPKGSPRSSSGCDPSFATAPC